MVNNNDTITLPTEVVKQALDAFEADDWQKKLQAAIALRAALHQPQDRIPDTEQPSAVQRLQGEQEPVAWLHADGKHQPLYTHPQPKREPLTEDEIFSAIRPLCNSDTNCEAIIGVSIDEYRAIESAHGIK